jgi:hypothetical protein
MSNVYHVATNVALQIVIKGVEKTAKKQDLTKPELLLIGRALGWLALMTAGTDKDLFKQLAVASDELKSANNVPSMVGITQERPSITAGRRHRKPLKGGVAPAALILGAIAMLYSGNTAITITRLEENRRIIRREAIKTIQSACPVDLLAGAPEKPLIDWSGAYARKVMEYEENVAVCDSTKSAVAARIKKAEDSLNQAWGRLPNDAAAFATVATAVMTAPAGPTAAITSATSIGAAVKQIAESVISGQLPSKPEDINKFVKAISDAFPEKEEEPTQPTAPATFTGTNILMRGEQVINPADAREAAAAAAAPSSAPAAASPAGPARRGRSSGGRKTKKSKKVRRATRRKLTFSY